MKTVAAIVENAAGQVIGAVLSDGAEVRLPAPIPRSQLASQARALAEAFGVELPNNPAIPPAE